MSDTDRSPLDWSHLAAKVPFDARLPTITEALETATESAAEQPTETGATDSTTESSTATTTDPQTGLWNRVARVGRVLRGSTVEYEPHRPGIDAPLATFEPPAGETEVDRYPVNAPFAAVSITYDDADNAHRYHTVEPDLDEFEAGLLDRVRRDIRPPLLAGDDAAHIGDEPGPDERLTAELIACIERYGITIDTRTLHALWYYLSREFRGYGRLDPLLQDERVEDISCDGDGRPVFIYHETYTDIETDITFEGAALDDFVVRLAQQSGQHISVGDPLVEATLPDGSRAELALGDEVTPHGSAFTIRQYAAEPLTPIDLLDYGTFDVAQLAYCWLCIEHNKSLLFAGGTAAGKTTSLNAVSMFIPPGAKTVTIEDTRELALAHDNWLAAVTRDQLQDGTDIDMYDLLRSALRHRPEYLLVGEVRGEEAQTLFQAMNTGHTTLSTIHADSIETVVNRLENEPINVPRSMVESLDLISVQTQRRLDGRRVRRAGTIAEIRGIDGRTGELDYASAFEWEPQTDSFSDTDSDLLATIRTDRGWSRGDLRRELRDRKRFLTGLQEHGVTDYRKFTALVGDYYADSEAVLERIEAVAADDDGGETLTAVEETGDRKTSDSGAKTTNPDNSVATDDSAAHFDPNAVSNRQ